MTPQKSQTSKGKTKPGNMPPRMILWPADVVRLTGKHHNTALRMLHLVRQALGKRPTSLVTVTEFSAVFEIDEEVIIQFMD
jgi:hypothetical protein